MRDILIVLIVVVAAVLALKRPWIGVMSWTWLSIMNPHRFAWGFAYSAPLAAITAGSTLLGLVFTKERQSPFKGAPVVWFAALFVWITISWLMGIDRSGDYAMWDRVMKIYLMTFVALSLLHTKHQIMAFAWVTALSIGLLAAKGGFFTVVTGGSYLVWGPPESFIADNNHFALGTVVAIPMLYFLQLQIQKKWMRRCMMLAIALCAASAIGSHSRGGLLALVGMSAVFWWRSQRKLAVGAVMLLAVLAFLPMMPQEWWDRMNTIQTYSSDDSAMGRINAWNVAWSTATHYFFGGGMSYQHQFLFDQFGPYETEVRAAHSIYFQMLGNHGFVGLALYLFMWLSAFRCAGRLRKNAKDIPEARWAYELGTMSQVAFVGFAIGGAFLSLTYFDLPYNIMAMVVLAKKWVEQRAWEREPAISFWEYAGFKKASRAAPVPAAGPARAPVPGATRPSLPNAAARPPNAASFRHTRT